MTTPVGPKSGVGVFDNAPLTQEAVWDDFDGPYGAKPNPNLWLCDTVNQGGVQAYTSDNVFLDGSGHLVLKASKAGTNWLSGRVTSRTKFNMLYGRVAASIKFPAGTSLWSAFWLLGINFPAGGEIDVVELVDNATTRWSHLHPTNGNKANSVEAKATITDLSTAFHEYWVEWRRDSITVGADQTVWAAWTPASLPAGAPWNFTQPMYAIINLALGGWATAPTAATVLPAQTLVDWFRYTPWV